jgi:hypothetical protein
LAAVEDGRDTEPLGGDAQPAAASPFFQLKLDDLRWAYDVEVRRAERADLLAAALLAATLPAGALLATLLDGRRLAGVGRGLAWTTGACLFLCALLAGWSHFAFLAWARKRRANRIAVGVTPAESVRVLWARVRKDELDAAGMSGQLLDAWDRRVSAVEEIARQKVLILFAAIVLLAVAALAFAGVLVWGL